MGIATPKILETIDIKYFKPKTSQEAIQTIADSWKLSQSEKRPVSVLLEISYW
jgi:sulfopyruvate decarboxylase subunit alpha